MASSACVLRWRAPRRTDAAPSQSEPPGKLAGFFASPPEEESEIYAAGSFVAARPHKFASEPPARNKTRRAFSLGRRSVEQLKG